MDNGQPKKPKDQPTVEEIEDRTLMVRRLLGQGQYDGQIKAAVSKHYGISPRTVEGYLRRARCRLRAETGRDKGDHRAESYAFYLEMRGDSKAQARTRLKAQERIDKLLGLEAPQQVNLSGKDGGPIQVREIVVRTREEAKALLAHRNGTP